MTTETIKQALDRLDLWIDCDDDALLDQPHYGIREQADGYEICVQPGWYVMAKIIDAN